MISLLLMTRCSGHGALVILIWSVKMRIAGYTWVSECDSGWSNEAVSLSDLTYPVVDHDLSLRHGVLVDGDFRPNLV
jgi:hypothetical protein